MRIAIMGIRGIPANYGGFETFAEELAPRLVERGHDVWVYCRSNNVTYDGRVYKGVNLVMLPTIGTKYLDTVAHTLLSVMHGVPRRYDAVLMCNAANALFCVIPRLAGQPVALNVDGIERLRKKWGPAGRAWYRLGEWLATKVPSAIVADAQVIQDYYRDTYAAESVMIPYGARTEHQDSTEALDALGVTPRKYVLYVSRLERENNADVVITAFASVKTDFRLVIVGDAPYASDYKAEVCELAAADGRVVLAGFVYGTGYWELQSHAAAYVQATEVGGTHPALIEAMGMGGAVLANGTDENREVLGDAGIIYRRNDVADLAGHLQRVLDDPAEAGRLGERAVARVLERYSWDAVTESYEALLGKISSRG